MLAGLVKSPSRLAPTRNPAAARERGELVLAAMVDAKFISDAMARTARGRPPAIVRNDGPGSTGYIADWVMDVLDDYVGPLESDVTVQTTIDPALQAAAEKALAEELAKQGDRYGVTQGALVAIDPDGACARWSAAATMPRASSIAPSPRIASPARPSSRSSISTALERGLTPETRARGRAGRRARLAAGEFLPRILRPGDALDRAGALAEHGRGTARA